jgi:O-methyltransferase
MPFRWARRTAQRTRLTRIYERYQHATMISKEAFIDNLELARHVASNPSHANHCVVECGTWRGGMSAGLIEITGRTRRYHFFDSFEGLPPVREIDGEAARRWQEDTSAPTYYNNCTASEEEFWATIRKTEIDPALVAVHKGFFEDTISKVDVGPIALLRLDGDWYGSTMCCLEELFPHVVSGGLILIDDYGTWDGCTRAVHEYLSKHRRPEEIRRHGRTGVPYLEIR